MTRYLTAISAILLFAGSQAQANDPVASEQWQAQITPYVWMSGLSGDVSASQAPAIFSVDKSFSDILEDLNGALFVNGFAHNSRFALLADFSYVSITENDDSPIPLFSSIEGDVEQISGMLAAGLRVASAPEGAALYVLAGARAWHVDATVSGKKVAGAPASIPSRESDTWAFVDPLVALRGRLPLTGRLSVIGYGDIGGFGVGSDITWQAVVTANYALTQRLFVSAGYRHLKVDYQDGGQLLDIDQSGPLVGATFKF